MQNSCYFYFSCVLYEFHYHVDTRTWRAHRKHEETHHYCWTNIILFFSSIKFSTTKTMKIWYFILRYTSQSMTNSMVHRLWRCAVRRYLCTRFYFRSNELTSFDIHKRLTRSATYSKREWIVGRTMLRCFFCMDAQQMMKIMIPIIVSLVASWYYSIQKSL